MFPELLQVRPGHRLLNKWSKKTKNYLNQNIYWLVEMSVCSDLFIFGF